jgi:hypothetical protein
MLGVSRGGVLPCWMQLVERERHVCSGQLLDHGQRHQRIVHALSRRSILPCWLWKQRRQRGVCCWQFLCDWERGECAVHGVPRRLVLPCWMQLVERERAVRCRQLLDCGGWIWCIVYSMCRGHVQRALRVDVGGRMPGVPRRLVLPCWMQLVERERAVRCRQLLNLRQRHQLVLQCLPRRQVLSCRLQQLEREWGLRGGKLLDVGQRH